MVPLLLSIFGKYPLNKACDNMKDNTDGQGATSMKLGTIFIISGVSTYAITCADLESSFDAAGFDKILGSIEFK